ncbi:MAG: helix-turn-helix transcriptional regulator, partial [Ruminococcus sp.]|nr:helix-turn-helix transcriptional regulator [Ruminococcus sp.]
KSEIDRLAEKHKEEIVPEEYNFFVENLSMLTPAEYRIYELYLSGKTAKQIAEILNITENTLKYHNKNIYSKLGISSRKQLLRFAALKQHRDGKEDWT